MIPILALLALARPTTLLVTSHGAYPTVGAALAAARAGDTVRVAAGVYHEHLVIDRAVVLLGEPGAVLDGDLHGTVLTVHAPAVIRGLTIRRSGHDQSREDAGLLATDVDGLIVEANRLEDVLFGIYLKNCRAPVIRHNTIVGQDLPVALRGDGIHLWYSHEGRVEDNRVERSRDVVIWFSNGTSVRGNHVRDSRYGLHYMNSNHSLFEANTFVANHVGAFIMYSKDVTFRDNVFADARGTTGRGLGFKDSDRIVADRNVLVKNAIAISIDNSPTEQGAANLFRNNVIAYNDVAVSLLPSVHDNAFLENDFRENVVPVRVTGGGTALKNRWRGNYWSDYAGFDADRDGRGDTPYVLERLSDDLFARHEPLQLFALSPAITALDLMGRVLPLLAPVPLVIDSAPRLRASPGTTAPARAPGRVAPTLVLLLAGLGATLGARRMRRAAWGTA